MSDILHSPIVLRLSGIYQRAGFSTVAEAFTAMMGGHEGSAPYLPIDIEYELNEDGTINRDRLKYWRPVTFEEWLTLPIRHGDMSINSVRQAIRVPTVVVCPKFQKTIMKHPRPTPKAIRERDGNRCQYTGVLLTNKTFSLDHVIPKSKGGKDTWQNLASCHRDLNSRKGNNYNHEVGLKLLKTPAEVKSIPLSALITENRHPDHLLF